MAVPPSSPSAALNGRTAAARMARRVASETAPSAPRRGFLASITSAPPSRAARASRASATLTSSCIGALLPSATADRLGFHTRDVKATGGGRGDDGPAAGTTASGGTDARGQGRARHGRVERHRPRHRAGVRGSRRRSGPHLPREPRRGGRGGGKRARRGPPGGSRSRRCFRSEEHTSELQSHSDLVCRLLLEKKKKNNDNERRNRAEVG